MAESIDWEGFYHNYRKPGFIPGFEILEKLGSGAFGLVYKARKESIGRLYAIKFLRVDDDSVRSAVQSELDSVRYFAQVDHPHLVSIEDQGEVCGIPYIVMAYGGELTLRQLLDEGLLERDGALELFRQVARGVKALHDRSLVHFDIKPSNVYLRGDIARVGDYGLAKIVSQTRHSLSFGRGTPHYMAPEMLRRQGDARCDVYSLGIVLFELLAGHTPFHGESEWEILRKHETEEPFVPRSIGGPERTVIERCLRKDPDERYQTVGELLAELDGRPVPAHAGAASAFDESLDGRELVGAAPRASRGPQRFFWFALFLCFGVGAFAFALFVTAARPTPFSLASAQLPAWQPPSWVTSPAPPSPPPPGPLRLDRSRLYEFPHCDSVTPKHQRKITKLVERMESTPTRAEAAAGELYEEYGLAALPALINALCRLDHADAEEHVFASRLHRLLARITGESMGFEVVLGDEIPFSVARQNAWAAAEWHDLWTRERAYYENKIRRLKFGITCR